MAAVRDMHRHHPGLFQTDVRTLCPISVIYPDARVLTFTYND